MEVVLTLHGRKGLQHLLVNVVVLLDLNFQTTQEFAPAIRGKEQMGVDKQ